MSFLARFSIRRRFITRAFCGPLVLALAAAALAGPAMAQPSPRPAGKPLRVVTTFTIIQDIAQNVAGTAAIVESVTKPGAGSGRASENRSKTHRSAAE